MIPRQWIGRQLPVARLAQASSLALRPQGLKQAILIDVFSPGGLKRIKFSDAVFGNGSCNILNIKLLSYPQQSQVGSQ